MRKHIFGHMWIAKAQISLCIREKNHWILYNVSMESKCPDETLCMRGMNLNLCILRMFEDTFSLGAARKMVKYKIMRISFSSVSTLWNM